MTDNTSAVSPVSSPPSSPALADQSLSPVTPQSSSEQAIQKLSQQVTYIDPDLTLTLAQASLAAYAVFDNPKTPCTPPNCAPANYQVVQTFTGWDYWFIDEGTEEIFGAVFQLYSSGSNPVPQNQFIVAFRGTDSDSDIYNDAFSGQTAFVPYSSGPPLSPTPNVCSGFYGIYSGIGGSMTQSMQQQVFTILEPLLNDASQVLITGHSLGGALSQLFTLDMKLTYPNVSITTLNFASPMVGDVNWQTVCNNTGAATAITRVINLEDDVPDYPITPFYSYYTVGAEFHVSFDACKWWLPISFELSCHSMLNLQTVLTNCVPLNPQVWVGQFVDAVYSYFEMCSIDPNSEEGLKKLAAKRYAKQYAMRYTKHYAAALQNGAKANSS